MSPTTSTSSDRDARRALRRTLAETTAQLDAMTAALHDVIALFEAGALVGAQGTQWRDQMRARVVPFVAETQAALRGATTTLDSITDAESV